MNVPLLILWGVVALFVLFGIGFAADGDFDMFWQAVIVAILWPLFLAGGIVGVSLYIVFLLGHKLRRKVYVPNRKSDIS